MTDYISREWLLSEYDRRHKGTPGGARAMIEEAPAADVRPVVRGEWVKRYRKNQYGYIELLRCSVCGEPMPFKEMEDIIQTTMKEYRANFCSNCGADMRKEN